MKYLLIKFRTIHNDASPYKGRVGGFILEDDEETPKAWNTKKEALEAMEGHILESLSYAVEL